MEQWSTGRTLFFTYFFEMEGGDNMEKVINEQNAGKFLTVLLEKNA